MQSGDTDGSPGAGGRLSAPGSSTDRYLTVPNALSALRLVGVPVFLVLVFQGLDAWAVAVLMVSGFTDWLDGKLARWLNQESRLGKLLDPAADRLYIFATLVGLTWRGAVPLAVAAAVIGRDVFLGALLPVLRRYGYGPLPVHFLGKAATFNLLAALPLLLLGEANGSTAARIAGVFGWAFAVWGLALYWWAGILYARQVRQLVRAARAEDRQRTTRGGSEGRTARPAPAPEGPSASASEIGVSSMRDRRREDT